MSRPIDILAVYLHLARLHHQKRAMFDRDRLLMLAAVFASKMGLEDVSATCRERILEHNAGHQIGKWPTVSEALESDDFKYFVGRVYRRYPQERAETLLQDHGVQLANERDAYFSDSEYAQALLG